MKRKDLSQKSNKILIAFLIGCFNYIDPYGRSIMALSITDWEF